MWVLETEGHHRIEEPPAAGERRKILFVLRWLGGGGAERVMLTLLRHLDRRRFEPHLALVRAKGPLVSEIPEDVPVHDLKAGRARYAPPAVIGLVRRLRPEIVISTIGDLNITMVLSRAFFPEGTRLLIRESNTVSAQLEVSGNHPRFWIWLYRHFYPLADKVICQSDCMLEDLAQNFAVPREKLLRIYNPVDLHGIAALADGHWHPFSGPGPHLLAVGRLAMQKGIDLLLEALVSVLRIHSSTRLTVIGDGPLRGVLEAQTDRLGLSGAVYFLGFVPDPYPYIRHADLLVLTSRYEGLPNVVLEALALGTPVVATDCPGGIREIAAVTRKLHLAEKSDAESLARAIVCALAAPGLRKAEESFSEFERRFGVETVVRQYEELFESVIRVSQR